MTGQPYSFQRHRAGDNFHRDLFSDIEKAVNDEFQAIHQYTRLAELTPNKNIKQAILGIRQDEIKHFHRFSKAYARLTGRYPHLSLSVPLPTSFSKGVQDALKDEQETVPFYRRLASQVSIPQIKEQILRAAEDEQRHAQYFSQIAAAH